MKSVRSHKGIFAFEDQTSSEGESENEIVIPEDLESVPDDELQALHDKAVAAFDELFDTEPDDTESVAVLGELADAIDVLRTETARRESVRAEAQAKAQELHGRIHGEGEEGEEGEAPAEVEAEATAETPAPEAKSEAKPEAIAAATVPAQPKRTQRINLSFSEVRARAPQHEVEPEKLAIVAAADVPGYNAGAHYRTIDELAHAFHERAKTTPVSASGQVTGPKIASIQNQFEHVISKDTSQSQLDEIIREVTRPDRLESALVAGGGWCAPSEITYDFFNIACEDGAVDLPTVGIQRGGIRFPVSPSYADVFTGTFTNATNPWVWTETDDILTVTGSVNKPCVRVPCPTFDERRLEAYGICLTAGNLTDNAYPEATENQLRLLRTAHYHAMNQRTIAVMVALSTAAPTATGGFFNDNFAASIDLPAAAEWAGVDYRTRFGMCDDDILEMVLPSWARAVIRADLAARTGVELLSVSDAQINDFFDVRRVRVQWVKDWQVRGQNQPGQAAAGATVLYPGSVQFMLYAPGTFLYGNGMTLDLGVIRDSVLNAENDHTAAWSEEAHLVARVGHESRLYTVGICAAGRTGSANGTDCRTA